VLPTRPSLPKQGALSTFASSFSFIADPKQFNHGIGKGNIGFAKSKTPTSRTLPWMLIWWSLMKAKLDKSFSLGSARSGTDEQMVQLDPHTSKSISELPTRIPRRSRFRNGRPKKAWARFCSLRKCNDKQTWT
jgi:hypothetical protein